MPRRAHSHRLLSASRLLPVYSRRPLPPRDTHLRSNTQTHSGDSGGPEEPARRGDPPLPAPTLPLPPPAGALLLPGSGLGVPRRQDGEALHEAGRTPGWGLRAGVSVPGQLPGRVSRLPAGRRGQRSALGPSRRTSPVAARLCVRCCFPCPFSLLRHGRSQFARFISLLSPRELPRRQRGHPLWSPAQPDCPRVSAPALGPGFAAGSEPSRRGHSRWAARAKTGRGRSVFRAPISFHGRLGCVVLPLAVRLREEPRLGDQKTTNPCILRDEGGRGAVLSVLVLFGWRWKPTKGRVGVWLRLFGAGRFTRYTRSLSNHHDNPARHYCIQPRERSTTCQRSQTARVVEMGLNREP